MSVVLGRSTLFPTCPVFGCTNLVGDPREVCGECHTIFGDYLQPATGPAPSAEAFAVTIGQSDRRIQEVMAERRLVTTAAEWRGNQRCWVCEERRACREELIGVERRWVCRSCEDL